VERQTGWKPPAEILVRGVSTLPAAEALPTLDVAEAANVGKAVERVTAIRR
jgi:hypothetical protein